MASSADTSSLMITAGAQTYYDDNFRNALEDVLPQLRVDTTTVTRNIDPGVGLRNKYDFYGLMQELNVPANLHWVALRLNGYAMSSEYKGDLLTILIPDITRIGKILQIQQTSTIITT